MTGFSPVWDGLVSGASSACRGTVCVAVTLRGWFAPGLPVPFEDLGPRRICAQVSPS